MNGNRARALIAVLLLGGGCATARDAKIVDSIEPASGPPPLEHHLDVDTSRLGGMAAQAEGGARRGAAMILALLEAHLGTVAQVRAPSAAGAVIAELPSAGYLLRARVRERSDFYCGVELELASTQAGQGVVAEAPWEAIDALETVFRGLATLRPPSRARLAPGAFARLHAQAEALARQGLDPPITPADYSRAPRPLRDAAAIEYYAPPSGPSKLNPER